MFPHRMICQRAFTCHHILHVMLENLHAAFDIRQGNSNDPVESSRSYERSG